MDRVDALLAQAFVLLSRQYLLIERLIEKDHRVLRQLEETLIKKEESLHHVLDVYNYIFALIDHIERYRKIAFSLPKLNKKSVEYRTLKEAIEKLRDIRDQIQHINNDIENSYTGPLMGAICWISGTRHFFTTFHDIGRQRSSPGIVLDTHAKKFLHEFCFVYNETYYDLNKAIEGIRNFNKYLSSSVHVEIDGKVYDPKDHFSAIGVEIQLPT